MARTTRTVVVFVMLLGSSSDALRQPSCGRLSSSTTLTTRQSAPNPWKWFSATAFSMLLVPFAAFAENELTALGANGFDSSLIDTECFTSKCGVASKSCLETNDCRKGMTCTAKCLGDNACITGCFAKYGNAEMSELLECSVERHECIKIAILPPGPDVLSQVPAPPLAPLANFESKSLEGEWYKVMGWNSRYDCFDCQRNSFTKSPSAKGTYDVDVEFSMPRPRRGETPAGGYPLHLQEKLVFDEPASKSPLLRRASGGGLVSEKKSEAQFATFAKARHAATQGHMFGLTFWENWSVLGENAKDEPQFKFVYYTGRTTQNTYDGAFVYAREPALPAAAKDHVYALARDAGMDPAKFCAVRNDCKTCGTFADGSNALPADANARLASTRGQAAQQQQQLLQKKTPPGKGLFMDAATAAEDFEFDLLDQQQPQAAAQATNSGAKSINRQRFDDALVDIADYLEDPHATARWLFDQQVKIG